MKVVIDTNVVISAVLKNRIPEEVILFIAENSGFNWIASQEILDEYRQVLRRKKFYLPEETIQKWDIAFDMFVQMIGVDLTVSFPRDQKDAKISGMRFCG